MADKEIEKIRENVIRINTEIVDMGNRFHELRQELITMVNNSQNEINEKINEFAKVEIERGTRLETTVKNQHNDIVQMKRAIYTLVGGVLLFFITQISKGTVL